MTIRPISNGEMLYFNAKPERDRGNDRDGAGTDRADRRQDGGDPEHDPRDRGNPTPHSLNGQPDEPVDRAVVLGDGEEESDADQGQEQAAGKAGDDGAGGLARHQGSDQEGADERQHAHVDRQDRGDHEHRNESVDRD